MSSDNQFTALGPAIVGFQTDAANIDRGAEIHGNQVGIKGFCDGPVGDGVQGFGSGAFSGVAGFGADVAEANNPGTGVFGKGGTSRDVAPVGGPGVRGIGGGGSGGVGVVGQAGPGAQDADGVQGFGNGRFSGVAGFGGASGNGTGVFGLGGAPSGPGVRGIGFGFPNNRPAPVGNAVGVLGQGGTGNSDGVVGFGSGTGAGVHGIASDRQISSSPRILAGFFEGDVFVDGNLNATGAKPAVVPFPDGSYRQLYCMESPECWFEDFGFGQLVAGGAVVELDPGFTAVVNTDVYHVFITEYDDHHGLYVTKRSSTGFEVRAKDGTATGTFGYRVLAKRKDIVAKRFEAVTMPEKKLQAAE